MNMRISKINGILVIMAIVSLASGCVEVGDLKTGSEPESKVIGGADELAYDELLNDMFNYDTESDDESIDTRLVELMNLRQQWIDKGFPRIYVKS